MTDAPIFPTVDQLRRAQERIMARGLKAHDPFIKRAAKDPTLLAAVERVRKEAERLETIEPGSGPLSGIVGAFAYGLLLGMEVSVEVGR